VTPEKPKIKYFKGRKRRECKKGDELEVQNITQSRALGKNHNFQFTIQVKGFYVSSRSIILKVGKVALKASSPFI
jgi:hypothetical protein